MEKTTRPAHVGDSDEARKRVAVFVAAAAMVAKGPVETEIERLQEETGPAIEHNLRLALTVGLGREATDEEWESFRASMSSSLPILKSLSATIGYLENEAERRAAWEKEIEARLSK